ncbi:MAG: glycosyltransferase family 1 protein [Ardenticatenaceae bacterium]|nr:glycosyltransferase family 1 protein [Ardenticatenaceae bacterium]MCB8988020.1 glycosyltransferase family 1 protein [Ardenticatenaceae bacterium]
MTRILFTFIGGNGHFMPLALIAHTAVSQGHTVAFACGPFMVAIVEAAGFQAIQLGASTGSPPQRRPLRPLDVAREAQEFRDHFARQGAQRRVPPTYDLCLEWKPDVVVCDETNFGGMVAAERLGLPYAVVLVMAAGSFVRAAAVGEALNELRARYALPPDPQLEMLHRYLALSPFPPSFRDPACPLPPTGHSFRPDAGQARREAPAWLSRLPAAPTVYFTLGTVFNMESGDLFSRVLAGLRELPVNVIVTIGNELDPAELGPQPANVHVERYIPQDLILPHCDVIVSHGGSGSVGGALQYGRPSVLIPMGADQPLNAARCQALGLAQVLDPIAATPESVRTAVTDVLSAPGYRKAALRFRDEFAALPGPDHAVRLLERLAAEKRPIVG